MSMFAPQETEFGRAGDGKGFGLLKGGIRSRGPHSFVSCRLCLTERVSPRPRRHPCKMSTNVMSGEASITQDRPHEHQSEYRTMDGACLNTSDAFDVGATAAIRRHERKLVATNTIVPLAAFTPNASTVCRIRI